MGAGGGVGRGYGERVEKSRGRTSPRGRGAGGLLASPFLSSIPHSKQAFMAIYSALRCIKFHTVSIHINIPTAIYSSQADQMLFLRQHSSTP